MIILAAPLQGYTEAPFRHFHREIYGPVCDGYFSPFVRVEHGEIRRRDLRDIESPLCANHKLVPQVIMRDITEFRMLINGVTACGYNRVDLNLGCPFALQLRQGRGAAMLVNVAELKRIAEGMTEYSDVTFSVKMRLGLDRETDWRDVVPVLNSMPLSHVTLHPRTARDEYRGPIRHDVFAALLTELDHPVIYNGDVSTPDGIDAIMARYPLVSGVMVGRGLMARPSLINEWRERSEWDATRRLQHIMSLHDGIYRHYCSTLCGEAQIISKIKPFWEYLVPMLDKKVAKAIKKATTLTRYTAAIAPLR